MSYLSCPRCRLTIRIRAPYLVLRNCPRCLARAGLPTPMYVSAGPSVPVPAVDGRAGIAPKPINASGAEDPVIADGEKRAPLVAAGDGRAGRNGAAGATSARRST
jgi:hypothetical protein